MVIVVGLASVLIGSPYLAISSSTFRSFSETLVYALMCVASGFLLVPWINRFSTIKIIQLLEKTKGNNHSDRPVNLHRIMRTYLYYTHDEKKPALFDWVRRQLGFYILGMDIRAHIPFSTQKTAKSMGIMILCVLLIAAMMHFMSGSSPEYAYQFTEGGTPTEIDENAKYRGAPDPEGDTETPQYGAKDTRKSDLQESPDTRRRSPSPADGETGLVERDNEIYKGEDHIADSDQAAPESPDTGDRDSVSDKSDREGEGLLSRLRDMIRNAMPEQVADSMPGNDEDVDVTPTGMTGLTPGNQSDSEEKGEAPEPADGPGEQSAGEPTRSSAGGESNPEGIETAATDNSMFPSSDEGEGDSGRSRISRGGSGDVLAQATEAPTGVAANAAVLQLEVRQESTGDTTTTSRQPAQPQRFNTLHELKPVDLTVTPADPMLTQRIPENYESTIKKLLSKP